MRFSIIIPVYNVADYLKSCLDSVLPAVAEEDEVILALGLSSDASAEISRQYEQQYSIVKLIWQSGKGLSNARNCAIQEAAGDYIICIDSDDYVDTTLFKEMLEHIRSGEVFEDVIVHDFYRFERKTDSLIPVFQIGDIPERSGMEFFPQMLRKRQCFWNVWRYIYRRQFLVENRIAYLENVLSEDVDYTTSVFLAGPTIRFVHCPFYVYTVGRGDSLMDSPTLKRLTDTVSILTDTVFRLNASQFAHAPVMAAQFQFEYLLNLALTVEIDLKDREAALELYKNWKNVLLPSADPIVRMSAFALGYTGARAAAYGLHWLKLIRRWMRRNIRNGRNSG